MQLSFERLLRSRAGLSFKEMLAACVIHRATFILLFLAACLATFLLVPWLRPGIFFPTTDAGRFNLHMRVKTATRVEGNGPHQHPDRGGHPPHRSHPSEIASLINNIGLPYSSINTAYSTSAPIGTMDTDMLVTLTEDHKPTADYVRQMHERFHLASFPACFSTSRPPIS